MGKYKKQIMLKGVNEHKINLIELSEKKTSVEIEKMISFLPFSIEESIEFLKKLGIIK